MSYKLRNRKKIDDNEISENENLEDYSFLTESEGNATDLDEQVVPKKKKNLKKPKSPYEDVLKDLEKLKQEDHEEIFNFEKSKQTNKIKKDFQRQNESKKEKKIFSCSTLFYIFFLFSIIIPSFFFMKKNYFKEDLDYSQIIDSQNEHLSKFSSKILKVGIEQIIIDKKIKPSVILLYTDQSKNYIHDFYKNISLALSKTNDFEKIYNLKDIEKNHLNIKSSLEKQKIILLDSLELLDQKSFSKLFGLIDEEDALVKNCIIFISLYTNEKLSKKNLMPKEMDEIVYNYLSNLWNNDYQFDAILNRLMTFVVFVF